MSESERPERPATTPWNREQRMDVRVPLRAAVFLTDGSEVVRGWVRNLSGGGAYVENKARFPEDTPVRIEFIVWEAESPVEVIIDGWVARTDNEGMGIQFSNLDAHMLTVVESLVAMYFSVT
ncbi:MAG: PilZ domain-containing protein [Nitrospirota bacterium]|nr:PilZ domain-containing protein [Nitrospirota bacterium]